MTGELGSLHFKQNEITELGINVAPNVQDKPGHIQTVGSEDLVLSM